MEQIEDNRAVGRIRDFFDALRYRPVPQSTSDQPSNNPINNPRFVDLLKLSDSDYLVINKDDQVIYSSEDLANVGLVKDARITSEVIRKLVRSARQNRQIIEAAVAIPRSAIGGGFHERRVRLGEIGSDGTVAVLIFDDSQAQRLDAVRRDFVANISHELKTPIGGISILAEAIAKGSDDPELVKNFSQRMLTETERLSNLVQEIIDLSRIQDRDIASNSELVTLNKIVEEAMNLSKVRAEKRNIRLEFVAEDEVDFQGDRKQLIMAFSNLIENAINYSAEGTNVKIVLRKVNEVAEIAISDQGIGIAEADLERIFERFYRVDPARSRDTGGTGLGLSIVKHVISNHGGDIQVWSVPGTGSTFTVLLPLSNKEAQA